MILPSAHVHTICPLPKLRSSPVGPFSGVIELDHAGPKPKNATMEDQTLMASLRFTRVQPILLAFIVLKDMIHLLINSLTSLFYIGSHQFIYVRGYIINKPL